MPKRKHEDEASGTEEEWKHEDEVVNQCRVVWKEHMETKHSFVQCDRRRRYKSWTRYWSDFVVLELTSILRKINGRTPWSIWQ